MVAIKRNTKRKSARKSQTGEKTGNAIVNRTNCVAASPVTTGTTLELRPNTVKFAATRTSRGGRLGAKSRRRYVRPAELLSSAAESRRDGAKTVAAKFELAKAGTNHFDCSAAENRSRRSDVMGASAAAEARSIPTAR
jgi:hypothetical protein